jgi:hypothetical protein
LTVRFVHKNTLGITIILAVKPIPLRKKRIPIRILGVWWICTVTFGNGVVITGQALSQSYLKMVVPILMVLKTARHCVGPLGLTIVVLLVVAATISRTTPTPMVFV